MADEVATAVKNAATVSHRKLLCATFLEAHQRGQDYVFRVWAPHAQQSLAREDLMIGLTHCCR